MRLPFVWLTVFAAAATACSGGGGGTASVPVAAHASVTPTPSSVTATVKLTLPALTTSSAARRPAFVSAGAAGLTVTVIAAGASPPPAPTGVYDLTGSQPSVCSLAGGTRTCTFSISAPIGSDTFQLAFYNLAPVSGAIPAAANLLAGGSATYTLVANTTNAISLTAGGVVASVALSPANSPVTVGLGGTLNLNFTAFDASGAAIVADPFAQPITLTITPSNDTTTTFVASGTKTLVLTAPVSPISLAYNGGALATSLSVNATTTVGSQLVATISTPAPSPSPSASPSASPSSTPAIGFALSSVTGDVVQLFGPQPRGTIAPAATLAVAGGIAQGVKFDVHGNLYAVGRGGPSTISIFANATGTPATIMSSSFVTPIDVAADSSGDVFVADFSNAATYEFLAGHTGNISPDVTITGISSPTAVAIDASNNMYVVSDGGSPYVGIYSPGATTPTATIANLSYGRTGGIAVDASGDIAVLDFDNEKIYVWAPVTPGSITGGYNLTRTLTTGGDLAVAFDRFGTIYAAATTHVEVFTTSAISGPDASFYSSAGPQIYGLAIPPGL